MKKIFSAIILIFSIVVLSSCRLFGETTLVINPVEKYLVNETDTQSVKKRKISIRRNAPNQIDYQFSIESEELKSLKLNNPNDLIIGSSPVFLEAQVNNYTVEETQEKYNPIVEMSSSNYGNAPINPIDYGQIQYRTCYAITNVNGMQSSYYNIAIEIKDNEAPESIVADLIINSKISYKTENIYDEDNLDNHILSNYIDNTNTESLKVRYYIDDTYLNNISNTEVIERLRTSEKLVLNNEIQYLPIYYIVEDMFGNKSEKSMAMIKLLDDIAPVLKVDEYEIDNEYLNNLIKDYSTIAPGIEDLIREKILNENIIIYDDIDGTKKLDNELMVNRKPNNINIDITVEDKSGNSNYYHTDTTLKYLKYIGDNYILNLEVFKNENNEYEAGIAYLDIIKGILYDKNIVIPRYIYSFERNIPITTIYDMSISGKNFTSLSSDNQAYEKGVYDFSKTNIKNIIIRKSYNSGGSLSIDYYGNDFYDKKVILPNNLFINTDNNLPSENKKAIIFCVYNNYNPVITEFNNIINISNADIITDYNLSIKFNSYTKYEVIENNFLKNIKLENIDELLDRNNEIIEI